MCPKCAHGFAGSLAQSDCARYGLDMLPLIIVLYILAAVLPLAGFGRLLYRTQQLVKEANQKVKARGHMSSTIADFNEAWGGDSRKGVWDDRTALYWDIGFVGLGLIAGAVASIWSLFLP